MRTTLASFAVITALLLSNPSAAQQAARAVTISGGEADNRFQREAIAALKARIGGTTRYTVAPDNEVSELEVSVVCLDMSEGNNIHGGICSFAYTYWPKDMWGMSVQLGSIHILTDPNSASAGEAVFEGLVTASSEAKLTDALARMQSQAQLYVLLNPLPKTTPAQPAAPAKSTRPTKP